jgi:hypothetical protein
MSKAGILPWKLASRRVPVCQVCLFRKATRHLWRRKTARNRQATNMISAPGDCVSVDQIESTTPGLIAQLKGRPTTKQYKVVRVFVDHYSDMSYVHL